MRERWRRTKPLERAGLLVCTLAVVTIASLAMGWTVLAGLAGSAAFSTAAASAGTDTRRSGDWTSTPGR